jgi:hypothetical protein
MNTTFDVLVIVLSSLLGIFLIFATASAILVFKLIKSVRNVVAKGEQLVDTAVDSAEAWKDALERNAGAVNIVKTLVKTFSKVNNRRK